MSNNFQELYKSKSGHYLYLIRGTDQGMDAWYYLLVDKLKLPLLKKECINNKGTIALDYYGEIIESGWRKNPPDPVKEKIVRKYIK